MSDSFPKTIKVTQPLLPDKADMHQMIDKIWDSKQLSNSGPMLKQLEAQLSDYLGSELSVFSNGTAALHIACKLLDLSGEVITTPFTFAATTNAIQWNQATPVFCDIEEDTLNIDADKIEALITEKTTAILPVHVFGNPCNVEKIQRIADRYGLKVLYDGAHAFGVQYHGKSIASFGDITMFSFHATKIYNTIEGGALAFNRPHLKTRADEMRNFGIQSDGDIVEPGTNGKLNEVQAAVGLLLLEKLQDEICRRRAITSIYVEQLSDIPGIRCIQPASEVRFNYAYFVILISPQEYGATRDELYEELAEHRIFARKYFYPLCSNFQCYRNLPSSEKARLPVANQIADSVLALPLYGALSEEDVLSICDRIRVMQKKRA